MNPIQTGHPFRFCDVSHGDVKALAESINTVERAMIAVRRLSAIDNEAEWTRTLQHAARVVSTESARWINQGGNANPARRYQDDSLREILAKAQERFGDGAVRIVSGPGHSR
jgi:hypothetical protein